MENEQLKLALAEATVQLRIWRLGAEHGRGPFGDLEALREAAGTPVSRFAALAGIPERTYRRRRGSAAGRGSDKGPWPAPRSTRSKRWRRSMPMTGRRGASQDRGDDARRRARGDRPRPCNGPYAGGGCCCPRVSGLTANRGRCFVGASFMTHPPAATGSGKPTSASSRPRPAGSGGSAR